MLKFKEFDYVKIGVTTNLRARIKAHKESFGTAFNYKDSYVIIGPKGYPSVLEKQILNDMINHMPTDSPFEECDGFSEIRSSKNIGSLLKILELKRKDLSAPFEIFKGIDVSGFRSDVIPEKYYPINEAAPDMILPVAKEVQKLSIERNRSFLTVANELLYEHLVMIGRLDEIHHQPERRDYFIVPNSYFPEDSSIQIQ